MNKDTGNKGRSNRGFAAMDENKQREIASKGGRIAHERGRAHEFNSEEARLAGKKGGEAVSKDRAHMAQIGRLGGMARNQNRNNSSSNNSSNQDNPQRQQ